jgi:hypothetical protein
VDEIYEKCSKQDGGGDAYFFGGYDFLVDFFFLSTPLRIFWDLNLVWFSYLSLTYV